MCYIIELVCIGNNIVLLMVLRLEFLLIVSNTYIASEERDVKAKMAKAFYYLHHGKNISCKT